jgi:hypothetical protein
MQCKLVADGDAQEKIEEDSLEEPASSLRLFHDKEDRE